MGKLTKIRFEVDDIFYSLVGAVNMSWTANEIGPQDPDVRQKLIAKETITAAISQAQLLLAHRVKRPKKTKEAEAPADEKAKTEGVEVGK